MDKTEEITVREYEDKFRDDIIDLILEIQQKEFGISITKEDQPDLSDVKNFYQTGNGNFWMALCEGRLVGTISLKDIGNRQAALRKMFVRSAYRGSRHKTAQILLEHLLGWARERGLTDIYLGTTEKFLAAHRFYEKNHFDRTAPEQLPPNFPLMKVDTRFYHLAL